MNGSKYNKDDLISIVKTIEKLKSEDYQQIFDILTENNENSYTQNSNGVFLNLSTVSDSTIDKVVKYLKEMDKKEIKKVERNEDVYCEKKRDKRTHKLSNYEQRILEKSKFHDATEQKNSYRKFSIQPNAKKN